MSEYDEECSRCGFPGQDHSREECENLELCHQNKRLDAEAKSLRARCEKMMAVVDLAQRMERRYSPEALAVMMGEGFVVELNKRLAALSEGQVKEK